MIERGDVTNLAEKTLRAIVDTTGATLPWLAFGLGGAPDPAHVAAAVERARSAAAEPTPVGASHTASDFTVEHPSHPPRAA